MKEKDTEGGRAVLSFAEWLEWAEKIAYGPLNLTPRQFEELQPHEFYALLDGYHWRKKYQEGIFAYFTAWLINTHLKEPISPAVILAPLQENQKNKEDRRKEDEEYLRKRFGQALTKK